MTGIVVFAIANVHEHVFAVGQACEQALHLGESREVTREPLAKGDGREKGFPARLRVLTQLASLAM